MVRSNPECWAQRLVPPRDWKRGCGNWGEMTVRMVTGRGIDPLGQAGKKRASRNPSCRCAMAVLKTGLIAVERVLTAMSAFVWALRHACLASKHRTS